MKGMDQIRYVLRYIAAMSKYRIQTANNIINYEIGCDTGNIGYYIDAYASPSPDTQWVTKQP